MGLLSACRTFAGLHAAKAAFDQEKATHPLPYLFWEATLACNLACRHCGSCCSPAESVKQDLSGQEMKRILKELAEASSSFGTRILTERKGERTVGRVAV